MRWNKTFTVVDCHAEGESGQVVVGGVFGVPGETAFDKRVHLETKLDDLRRLILFEPRGAAHHNANVVFPSNHPDADMAYVIMESTEYPAMSGSNTMCVATVLLETGMLPMQEPVTNLTLESPAGLITVRCECRDGKVTSASLVNQPAFVYHLGYRVDVPGLGEIDMDIAYGGMTYCLVDAQALGFEIQPAEARQLCELGQRIKRAAAEQVPAATVTHPENDQIPGITQTLFAGPLLDEGKRLRSRNAVVVSPGRCDRSPCGTGTSARLAVLHARDQIRTGQEFIHESIIGSTFRSSVVQTTTVGSYPAVIPQIAGQAWITGVYQMGLDPTDPFPRGFTLGDTWLGLAGDPVRSSAEG